MQLTNFQRACKLGRNLLETPANLPRYISQNLLARSSPLALELPWFSYGAIDFLVTFLRPNMAVFEFGSGGSTIFFSRRCAHVDSVEDDPIWAARVRDRANQLGLANVRIAQHAFNFVNPEGFEQSAYLGQVRQGLYDVIVVDGADNDYTIRPICFRAAEDQIKPGGIIVVDDSWRYTDLRTEHRGRRLEIFESVGPARFGVTSTDVYFY